MRPTDIHLAMLLAFCVAAGSLAAADGAKLPAPGSTTSDGFTVSAQWHAHYTFTDVFHGKYLTPDLLLNNPRLRRGDPFDTSTTTTEDAYVTEEVNKQTGQHRAVIRSGEWHWQYRFKDPTGSVDHKASGGFRFPEVSHSWDGTTREPMVYFQVVPADPANIEELRKAGITPFAEALTCRTLFETKNLTYREKKDDLSATPPWRSHPGSNWHSELIIIRTAQKLEAEIKPADGFKDWVPTMNGALYFNVRMVEPPDLAVPWTIKLNKTSNLPGVCCNADITDFPETNAKWQYLIKKDSYDLIFDFRKYDGKKDRVFMPVEGPWQVLKTKEPVTSFGFIVDCLDYGAYGQVQATAQFEGQPITAIYKETGEPFVRIPYATNKNDDYRIAQAANIPDSNTWSHLYDGDAKMDLDSVPPGRGTCKGDGLTVFEEYRGFFVRESFDPYAPDVHRRLTPSRKDVFIFMSDDAAHDLVRYLADFQAASGLDVHFVGDDLRDEFVDPQTRVVNFNHGDIGHDQHAIQLINYPFTDENGILGVCDPGLGPPRNVHMVYIDVDEINDNVRREGAKFRDYLKQVVLHELGHAVGIEHHGSSDRYFDPKYGRVAREGGQHSGDMDCAMRYVGAEFYLHNSWLGEPHPKPMPYNNKREHLGLNFCDSKTGTGINARNVEGPKIEVWYCGNATVGNCKGQIVVNDHCDGSGSGGDSKDRGSGGAGLPAAASPPDDAPEKAARRTQSDAHVSARLSAGGMARRELIPGEALVLDLKLTGHPNASLSLGATGKPWPKQILFKTLDASGKLVPLQANARPVGKPTLTDYRNAKDGAAPQVKPAPEQIKIAPENLCRVAFAIDGSETAKLPGGELRVFATLEGKSLVSGSVTIKSRKLEELSAEERARADIIRTLSGARLDYADENFGAAERRAREALAKEPKNVAAHLILARSLEKQNKLREAYDAYGKALENTPPPRDPKVGEPPLEIIFALDDLREKLGIQLEPPPEAAAGPFTAHALFAETGGNTFNAPFSVKSDRLVFEWQLANAGDDPIGARWIAADTSGVAPPDHLIATSKSDPRKAEGRFTLKSPTAGFPPGHYRVEIWQSGKEIYREAFEISR